ncbi:MAG TPA: hypothetical protein VEA69_22270 [Tepidisphaeraceae bacterium]|nr:hypothetical protein [Tepidisphaeraceae bacterium]
MAAGAPPTSWTTQLARAAKADPKKAAVLGGLVVVMVVMWVRLIGGPAAGPKAAVASPTAPARAGGAPVASAAARGVHRAAAATAALQDWAARPLSPLSRNLFAINYDFFPQDGSKAPVLRVPQGDGFWDQLAKSMTARADQRKEHEVLVENLRLQAAQLKVQSTVMGASPKALVNGELVGIGDVVASFRVDRIDARRIVVEREGIKLEIRF